MKKETPQGFTLQSLTWLLKARANPKMDSRRALQYAQLLYREGKAWLVMTDTHRVHAISSEGEFRPSNDGLNGPMYPDATLIHVRRLVALLNVEEKDSWEFYREGPDFDPHGVMVKHLEAPAFPKIENVVPRPDALRAAPCFVIDSTYLSQALSYPMQVRRIGVFGAGVGRPLLFTFGSPVMEAFKAKAWAVVMPMHDECGDVTAVWNETAAVKTAQEVR